MRLSNIVQAHGKLKYCRLAINLTPGELERLRRGRLLRGAVRIGGTPYKFKSGRPYFVYIGVGERPLARRRRKR